MDQINIQNEEFWRQLEALSLAYISSKIKTDIPQNAELTRKQKDGGFDGEIIIDITEDMSICHRILFESKFRTSVKTLPLSDCSKALIIAFNRAAQTLFIVTNVLFSEQSKQEIDIFKKKVNLNIIEVDGFDLKKYVETNKESLQKICSIDFLNYIEKISDVNIHIKLKDSTTKSLHFKPSIRCKNKFIYKNSFFQKEQTKYIATIKQKILFTILTGNAGVGKTFFLNDLFSTLDKAGYSTTIFNLQQCQSPRILFIKLLESLWNVSLSEYLLNTNRQEFIQIIQNTSEGEIEDELFIAVIQALYADMESMQTYADNYYYLLSKYIFKLLVPYCNVNRIVWAFTDLNKANIETIDFLYTLLSQIQGVISVIVELRPHFVLETAPHELVKSDYYRKFTSISNQAYCIRMDELENDEAIEYLKNYLPQVPYEQLQTITNKIGRVPLYLNMTAIFLKSQISIHGLYQNAIPNYLLDSWFTSFEKNENGIIDLSLAYFNKDPQIALCFAITGILDGLLPVCLIEYLYSMEKCHGLYEKLEKISYYTFFRGAYRVKHDFIFDAMKRISSEKTRYYAAKAIYKYVEKFPNSLEITPVKRFELLYEQNEYQNALLYWRELIVYLNCQHEYYSIVKYGNLALKCLDNLEFEQKNLETQQSVITSILDAYIQLRILNTEDFNRILRQFETICNLNKYMPIGKTLRAKFLYYKWNQLFYGAKIQDSYDVIVEAKEIIDKNDSIDSSLCENIHWAYALSHKRKSTIHQAVKDYNDSLKQYPESTILQVGLCLHQAHIYLRKEPRKTADICQKLLENVASKNCPFHETLQIRIDIVMAEFYSKQYEKALCDCREVLQIAQSVNAAYQIGRLYNIYAACLLMKGGIEEAISYFTKARFEFKESGNTLFEWRSLFNQAQILLKTGNGKKAMEHFKDLYNGGIPNLSERETSLTVENSEFVAFLYIVRLLKAKGQYIENNISQSLNSNVEYLHMKELSESDFNQILNKFSYIHADYLIVLA